VVRVEAGSVAAEVIDGLPGWYLADELAISNAMHSFRAAADRDGSVAVLPERCRVNPAPVGLYASTSGDRP
jgi:hypothetical protein